MKNGHALKIEKGVPVPAYRGRKRGEIAKILMSLKKGDSVLLPGVKMDNARRYARVYVGAGNYACRQEGDGFRIWRV